MLDYIKKYQDGGSTSSSKKSLSDKFIKEDLAYIEPKVKSIMGGLSKQVFDESNKENLLSLDNTVNSLELEVKSRRTGKEGNSKFKDYSDEKLMDHYKKLNTYREKQIKKKVDGYTGAVLDYLDGEWQQVKDNPMYTTEDRMNIEAYFAKQKRDWSAWGDKAYTSGTFQTLKDQIMSKEIGYTKNEFSLEQFKNGGKLVPKFQTGNSLLSNDPSILDMIRGEEYVNEPQAGSGVYSNDPSQLDPDGDGYINEPHQAAGTPVRDYINAPQNTGEGYVNDPALSTVSPFKSLPNFKLNTSGIPKSGFGSPSKGMDAYNAPTSYSGTLGTSPAPFDTELGMPANGTFGNQVDRSFGQNKGVGPQSKMGPATVATTTPTEPVVTDKKVLNRGANNPFVSRTGLFGGSVQWNDIAQYLLAKKAYDRPVAQTPVHQESFQAKGSRNVRSISGIDSSIRNTAMRNIEAIGGEGYQGSDPIMNMITNMNISKAKKDAKMEWTTKEAEHLRQEEARYAAESEQKRQQVAADLVESNRVSNANKLAVTKGKHAEALAEQERESQYSKNLSSIFSNIQGRWNANAKQRNTMRASLWKENRDRQYQTASSRLDSVQRQLNERDFYQRQRRDEFAKTLDPSNKTEYASQLAKFDKSYQESNKDLYKKRDKYATDLGAFSGDKTEEVMQAHDEASMGDIPKLNFWGKPKKDKKKKA